MTQGLLVAALAVAIVVIAWLFAYRVRHPHTKDDLKNARRDSITRSRSVVSGKVQEHLAPLFPEFISQFNPKDARFLGSPLDFVVFDGLDDGEVRRVVFVEVKTGRASLASRERPVATRSKPVASSTNYCDSRTCRPWPSSRTRTPSSSSTWSRRAPTGDDSIA